MHSCGTPESIAGHHSQLRFGLGIEANRLQHSTAQQEQCHGLCAHVQVLPEKETKAIAAQMFEGLAYLNGPSRRIIHYDLKPANILFDQLGLVKITVSCTACPSA